MITIIICLIGRHVSASFPLNTTTSGSESTRDSLVIVSIDLRGNKITRNSIIFRELLFKAGDTVSLSSLQIMIAKSRENLLNTQLFNFVTIEQVSNNSRRDAIRILIDVVERWYIWPIPILKISDRNFNVWWETKELDRLSYGFYLDWKNVRGRMENIIATVQFGYDELLEFQYKAPYLNRQKTLGAGFGAGLKRNRDVPYVTETNKHRFFTHHNQHVRKDWYLFWSFFIRPDIYNTHEFLVRYDHHRFVDSLVAANPYYSDGMDQRNYASLYYKFKSDHRDYQSYPLSGYYFDLEISKVGLGLSGDKGVDFLNFGSTFRKYWKLSHRWYVASGLNARFASDGHQPWFMVRGIGYDRDVVRGYEYYVVDGQYFGILKNNLKFALIPRQERNIGFIRNEKFGLVHYALYMNVFADMGYVDNREYYGSSTNDLENEMLIGYGFGIDFVTYYDIVIRAEYSFNKRGESGLFIHFRAPI